jgi:hypothetical protein
MKTGSDMFLTNDGIGVLSVIGDHGKVGAG